MCRTDEDRSRGVTAMRWTVQSVYWRLESNHDGLRDVVVEDDMVGEEKGSEHEGCDDEEESEKGMEEETEAESERGDTRVFNMKVSSLYTPYSVGALMTVDEISR